jgi:hypothetical protein
VRRAGAACIIAVVLVLMGLSWLLDRWTEVTRYFIRLVGFRHLEEWLKRHSVWWGLVFLPPMIYVLVKFKVYELHLFLNGHYILFSLAWVGFKVVFASVFHYVWHIYYEKLLRVYWFAHVHHEYLDLREWVLAILHAQKWYKRAVAVKHRVQGWFRNNYTRWHVARRLHRRT